MLTVFSFDADFLKSPLFNNKDVMIAHSSLLELWKNYGVLILPKNGRSLCINWISQLPPKFQQRWMQALEYNKFIECNGSWGEFSKYSSFEDLLGLREYFSTAMVADEVGISLSGSDEALHACPISGFEVVGAGCITESKNFNRSKINNSSISSGTDRELIWREKFLPLCKHSKNITIVDRYLFDNILSGNSPSIQESSIKKFLNKVSLIEGVTPKKIKIISHGGIENSDVHTNIVSYFYAKIFSSPPLKKVISSISLISQDDTFFKQESHDRHMGFDIHVCEVGIGMAIFDSRPAQACTFTMKHIDSTILKEVILNAERKPLWVEYIV